MKTNEQIRDELHFMQELIHDRIDPKLENVLEGESSIHIANYLTIASQSVYVALECFRSICRIEELPTEQKDDFASEEPTEESVPEETPKEQ